MKFSEIKKVRIRTDHRESAQKLINAYRIHYNFVRNCIGINMTPAKKAGIKLNLGENKIESLIKLANLNKNHSN